MPQEGRACRQGELPDRVVVGSRFAKVFDSLSRVCYDDARQRGFYDRERNEAEAIALMITELAEAVEGARHGNPPDEHLPDFDSVEVELADCIIRIADWAGHCGYRVGAALVAKMNYNATRPYKHGKEF
jgi:NTP pyrophosphatase (non-canonical NTP hydrolase)